MNFRIFHLLFSLFAAMMVSCADESSNVGSKWVDSSFYNVLVDTCTVHISTILTDSITTSGDTITQIGRYSDNYRGSIRGAFYTEYNVASASIKYENIYVFDSITMAFTPSGDFLGDTLSTRQNISIYRLTENIALMNDGYLYNTSRVRYNPAPLVSFSYRPMPKSKKKFEVRLPDEFGKEFFDLVYNQSSFLDSQERFRLYFPGLAILPEDDSSCITGFAVNDTSLCLTMYYREIQSSATERTLTFTSNSARRFNQAGQDFTNTPFEGIVAGANNAMPSRQSGNVSYLQGLSGVYSKLEFPYLNNLRSKGEMVTIESAILYLYPVRDAYGDVVPLPQTLTLYTANENNVTQGVITDSSGEAVQDGNLVADDPIKKSAYYSFDITSFLQANLGTSGMNRQNLMLMLPNTTFLTTVESLVLGDTDHATSNIKLQILFKVYNNQ